MGKNTLPMTPLFAVQTGCIHHPRDNGIPRTWIWHVAAAIGSLFFTCLCLPPPHTVPKTPFIVISGRVGGILRD
ncbi:hypothetical protein CEXT_804671 [Caerostris extrusa]|uniref:Uncharacterized protein n=1 Tax=Caerostris extrusa TaxID=172846 RepID=A0AAV4Y1N6_CAEEX|nr:hypothetical protein CEXT_804671 [Caerostris extrusa]